MTWKEMKEWCAKHKITLGINTIRFSQIPETKEYFDRRPKWEVFEFMSDMQKCDGSSLMNFDRYVWTKTGRKSVKAPMFFYRPTDFSSISNYDVDLFLEKGKIPTQFFRRWSTEPVPIYTADDLEKAYTELITYLKTCKTLQNSQDLKNWTDQYKQKMAELDRINNEIKDIKKKYKQSFCKQANIATDF